VTADNAATWRVDLSTSSPLTELAAEHVAADAAIHGLDASREISPGARQEAERQRYAGDGVRQRREPSGSCTWNLSAVT